MDVEVIEMPAAEARAHLKEYRTQLHRVADAEYSAIAAGYEELAKGHALLNVANVIRQAPRDEKHRPALAIARADRKQVEVRWSGSQVLYDCSAYFDDGGGSRTLIRRFDIGRGFPGQSPWLCRGYALVPIVPAGVRTTAGNPRLRECFVLWEVEAWSDSQIGATPDRDPYLLRHLGGELYTVLAAWDLTELERAVMAGRASQ